MADYRQSSIPRQTDGHSTGRGARCSVAYYLSYARALRDAACFPVFRHGYPSTDGLRLYVTEVFSVLNHSPVIAICSSQGREEAPSGAVIDIQSVKPRKAGGLRGYDAGKKVRGQNGMPRSIPMAALYF